MNRRRALLVVLAAALVYFVWTRGSGLLDSGRSLAGTAGSGGSRRVVGAEVELLRTAALDRETGVFRPGRDLFRFGSVPVVPGPVAPPPRPRPPRPRPVIEISEAVVEPPVQRPPPIDFTYMGSFGPVGNKIAVFTDQETIYNAAVGEVIKDAFRLASIGFESADIEFVDFPEAQAQRLPVGGL